MRSNLADGYDRLDIFNHSIDPESTSAFHEELFQMPAENNNYSANVFNSKDSNLAKGPVGNSYISTASTVTKDNLIEGQARSSLFTQEGPETPPSSTDDRGNPNRLPRSLDVKSKMIDSTQLISPRYTGSATPDSVRGVKRPYSMARTTSDSPVKRQKSEYRARSSIPTSRTPAEFGRQCVLAAYSSRLDPYSLHPEEYQLLRKHITLAQVTIYLSIRNAILRIWTRNPLISVSREEAAGCARDGRYFNLALFAYEWLMRRGYINFGCAEDSWVGASLHWKGQETSDNRRDRSWHGWSGLCSPTRRPHFTAG